jgi:regulatory protein YycI of two-component signal transduction system YycFG
MRHRRSQMQLFVMILMIVVLILFRVMINRAGNAAIEKVKQADEEKRLRQEEVQRKIDAAKEDPLMEELQKRIDDANDPLEELKPKLVTPSTPEPQAVPTPAPAPDSAPADPSAKSSSH